MSRLARIGWLLVLYGALVAMAWSRGAIRWPDWLPVRVGGQLASLNRHLERNPKDGSAYALRADYWLDQGDYVRARQDLEKALQHGYLKPPVHNNLAWSLAHLGLFQEALPVAREAVARQRASYSLDTLAFVQAGLGNRDEALELYALALALDPTDDEIRANRAALLRAEP
ncbi:hypothetical protein DYH09_25880 [bacterium CPR1]|nr:hypothetical protein [bacterium CPR1]